VKRLVWALGALALLALAQPAWAQMADALGKALPVSDLEAGTVTVRVVDGTPSKPRVGVDVELMVPDAGSARAARTDAEGRATFVKLPAGDRYRARVTITQTTADGQEQKLVESDPFEVPAQGGLRILLSTSPWQGGGMAAAGEAMSGMPGMAGGMPDARQMSGISRPQPGDPRGQLTVRVVRGQMSNNVADQPVHLVGYAADGAITLLTRRTDAGGRAVFEGLVPDKIAYYAMTELPRRIGERTVSDRVSSGVIIMPPEVGLRLLLAGAAVDAAASAPVPAPVPPVEDLERVADQDPTLGPGEVLVQLFGQPEGVREVELLRLESGGATSVGRAPISAGRPSNVRGVVDEKILPQPDLAAGTIVVALQRVTNSATTPLGGVEIEVEPLGPDGAVAGAPLRQLTDAEGRAMIPGLTPGAQVRVVARVHGARVEGKPFAVAASGGQGVGVNVAWDDGGAEARFGAVPATPDAVYYARAQVAGKTFSTAPFQAAVDRGASLRMLVLPSLDTPVALSFHAQGIIDDVYMGFQIQLTISNFSYAPWDPGPEGFLIPLPAGFVGAQVDEQMTVRVGVDKDRGFLWRGAIPPGGAEFMGFFSLPIAGGTLTFDLPLPHGAFNSLLALQHTPGMKVEAPANARGREWTDPGGRTHYVISGIQIRPAQRMVLTARGLPQEPAWQRYVAWGAGIVVLGLLLWGASGVFFRRAGRAAEAGEDGREEVSRRRKLEKRREHLLDELVTLESEKSGLEQDEYEKRKGKLTRQLESVYHDLATGDRAAERPRT
jgi:hypothetical protein